MSTTEDQSALESAQQVPGEDDALIAQDPSGSKRKRDEDGVGEETAAPEDDQSKKLKSDNPTSAVVGVGGLTALPGHELKILEISPEKVGQVIGSKGMIIQEIQTRSGARAYVNQEFPEGVNRQVNITGTPEQIQAALDLINLILEKGPTAIHINSMTGGALVTRVVECTQPQVGKIIGTGGATIKEIQSKSGARIQIDQDFPPEVPRKVNITGTDQAVAAAVQLVQTIMMGGPAMLGPSMGMPGMMGGGMGMGMPAGMAAPVLGPMQQVGMEFKQQMEVPKLIVGKIIGRGGETITLIQRKSGCRCLVDQQVPEGAPCKVNMTGTPQTIAAAISIIQEIMVGVPVAKLGANVAANPMGMMGGMPGAGMYGMYGGAMGMGMMGMYGGMGGAPAAAPAANPYAAMYGGMYGGAAPNAYGGAPNGAAAAAPAASPYGNYGASNGAPAAASGYGSYNAGTAAPASGYGGYNPATAAPSSGYGSYNAGTAAPASGYGGYNPATAAPAAASYGGYNAAAKPAAAPVAASPWSEHKTDDGVTYWYNSTTGVSQWERPKNQCGT